jgi:hypothetical protein
MISPMKRWFPPWTPMRPGCRLGASRTALACLLVASCTPSAEHEAASLGPMPAAVTADSRRTSGLATSATPSDSPGTSLPAAHRATSRDRVQQLAASIAGELAERCPVADPADQAAFESCRKAMFHGSTVRASLAAFTIWGRQNKDPARPLKETNLTQFAPDVLTGMYLPLFMFTGRQAVTYSATERLYRIELGVRFRNRLKPGQFPYPFWHEDEKWRTYENANAILLWVDPAKLVVRAAQFTPRGSLEPSPVGAGVQRAFDGKWMWTDASGHQQPKVTLFDGLFRPDNPYLPKLDAAYRQLALSLREGQCMACHVPSNPYKTKRLVLLQTPAHAAAEIQRVMASVRRGSMPLDETSGVEEPLAEKLKGPLLERAAAFEKAVVAAKAWETRSRLPAGESIGPGRAHPPPGRSALAPAK